MIWATAIAHTHIKNHPFPGCLSHTIKEVLALSLHQSINVCDFVYVFSISIDHAKSTHRNVSSSSTFLCCTTETFTLAEAVGIIDSKCRTLNESMLAALKRVGCIYGHTVVVFSEVGFDVLCEDYDYRMIFFHLSSPICFNGLIRM